MKLEKAIEIKKLLIKQGTSALHPDAISAMKLGIEAINAIIILRRQLDLSRVPLLPGETED